MIAGSFWSLSTRPELPAIMDRYRVLVRNDCFHAGPRIIMHSNDAR
jgi:hypothetical protein